MDGRGRKDVLVAELIKRSILIACIPLQTALAKANDAVVDVAGVRAVVVVDVAVIVVEFSFCFLYIDTIYTHNPDRSFNIKNRMVSYSHHYLLAVEWRSCEFQMMQLNVNMVVNVRDR